MPPRPLATTLVATIALSASTAAHASADPVPNPASTRIVMGSSVGGLKLGASPATMTKLWGRATKCAADRSSCAYYAQADSARITVTFTSGTVSTIELAASPTTHKVGTLGMFRDEIGVHVGLPGTQLQQAYPTGSWHSAAVFVIPGPGHGETVLQTTKGKITDLMVRIAPSFLGG